MGSEPAASTPSRPDAVNVPARRVLAFVGSPRQRGNTDLLVARILDGAKAAGAVTETVHLGGLTIRECDGCHACWRGKPCAKRDDMNGLYPRIVASDLLVFGTPVYWYGPTALMKGLIDRFVYFNCPANRPGVRNKGALLAIPHEENSPETAGLVVAMFERSLAYLEMRLVGRLVAPGVDKKGDILGKPRSLQEAYELGRQAVEGIG
jgi:multimeric flavodoxin WrbA